MHRVFDFLRTDDLPKLTRRNFVAELRQISLWGIVAGAVEGPIAAVVASKTFDAPGLLASLVFTIPISINLLNVVWSVLIRGRRRVRTFVVLMSCAAGGIFSIALTPADWQPWAAYVFAAQIALTHLFISGLITLRTTMWKHNYPQSHRADRRPAANRPHVALAADRRPAQRALRLARRVLPFRLPAYRSGGADLVGAAAAYARAGRKGRSAAFSRRITCTRPVTNRSHREDEVCGTGLQPVGTQPVNAQPVSAQSARGRGVGAGGRLWAGLKESAAILRDDRPFAKYMFAQFLLGSSNFLTDPVLVYILTKRLDLSYFSSTFLLYQVPIAVLLVSIRFWAKHFDRVGVLRFRIVNSACWTGSYACVTVAMAMVGLSGGTIIAPAIAILFIGRILRGLGRGGGAIAWNIGHLHFARDHQTELYMGLHLALTGLRGLVMPFLGWMIYYYLDWAVFAIGLAMAGISHILFRRLAATDRTPPPPIPPTDEELVGPSAEVT